MRDSIFYVYIDDLIDCAQHNEAVTGIQRVVIETIKGMCRRFGTARVRLIAHRHSQKFNVFSSDLFSPDWICDQEEFCRFFGVPVRAGAKVQIHIDTILSQKYAGIRFHFHRIRVRIKNLLTRGKTFRKLGATTERLPDQCNKLEARRFEPEFGLDDIVYIPGEFWNRPIEQFLDTHFASNRAPKLVLYVHDLIPLVAPEYTGEALYPIYKRLFDKLLGCSVRVVANSQNTANDVAGYINSAPGLETHAEIIAVPLAHEFTGDAARLDFLERRRLTYLTRLPYVLVIGTANARKNAWATAYVWNGIREQLGPKAPRIIFVDRDPFLNEPFRQFMDVTKNIYGLAEVVRAPTDDQLAFLYQHCMFTIYPSLYEGWGLPAGESIWMGKPVVAANATSIREVGGDFIDYFDPADLQSFHEKCLKLILDRKYRESRAQNLKNVNLRRWDVVISETIDAVEGATGTPSHQEPLRYSGRQDASLSCLHSSTL